MSDTSPRCGAAPACSSPKNRLSCAVRRCAPLKNAQAVSRVAVASRPCGRRGHSRFGAWLRELSHRLVYREGRESSRQLMFHAERTQRSSTFASPNQEKKPKFVTNATL